jgi:hypothetical protein
VLIIIRLRYKLNRICGFPASQIWRSGFAGFPIEHNQDDLGIGRATLLASVLNMQNAFDLWHAQNDLAAELDGIPCRAVG